MGGYIFGNIGTSYRNTGVKRAANGERSWRSTPRIYWQIARGAQLMRKAIVLGMGALIGIALGYLGHGIVATAVLRGREPYLFSAYIQYVGQSLAFCSDRTLEQQRASLLNYGTFLSSGLGHPDHELPSFYYALAEARLSTVEAGLSHPTEAMRHMQNAQQQVSKLGWTDVTPKHILGVVAHVYQQPESSSSGRVSACSEQPSSLGIKPQAVSERR
jgi:hypothetical protein